MSGPHSLDETQLPFLPGLMLQVGLVPPAAVSNWANRDSWITFEVNKERAKRVSVPRVPVTLGKSFKKNWKMYQWSIMDCLSHLKPCGSVFKSYTFETRIHCSFPSRNSNTLHKLFKSILLISLELLFPSHLVGTVLLELEVKTSEIQSDVLFHKAYHSEYFQMHALWLIKKSGL